MMIFQRISNAYCFACCVFVQFPSEIDGERAVNDYGSSEGGESGFLRAGPDAAASLIEVRPPPRVRRSSQFQSASSFVEEEYVAPILTYNGGSVGHVSSLFQDVAGNLEIEAGGSRVHVTYVDPSIIRIRFAPTGSFGPDPTQGEIVGSGFPSVPHNSSAALLQSDEDARTVSPLVVKVQLTDGKDFFSFSSLDAKGKEVVSLHGSKDPLLFSLWKGTKKLWQEDRPMEWSRTSTAQVLKADENERFYGGGMQNGNYDHTGKAIFIRTGGGWDDGGRADPSPFYMSSNGYGVLRNTFMPGVYDFRGQSATAIHDELGLDVFHFAGDSMKDVLGLYTSVSGKPPLLPIWAHHFGDADCYHNEKHGWNTSRALDVADGYKRHDFPRGWMLINDGYGCGYGAPNKAEKSVLVDTVKELRKRGFRTGLWTSTGLTDAPWEIGVAGSRVIKTDVAWVGKGYHFAMDAVKQATNLMADHSDARPFTWTVCGWAGTHSHAAIWTGDNSGSWEYIRMQIPTIVGSGMSAFAHASGDVDGIFHGSPKTYVRDLQWKTYLSVGMGMSGWAPNNKQPWVYGEPYTSMNRRAMKQKVRLTPYLYSLSHLAHQTGVPPARGMELEFPEEHWEIDEGKYQFMSGPFFLVAPVFRDTNKREGISLPSGEWVDYSDGTRHIGPKVINNYDAPLSKLPVFVKAGAIVPMWPDLDFAGQRPPDPMTLDVYPPTAGSKSSLSSSFSLFEDDGVTRAHQRGQAAVQKLSLFVGKHPGDALQIVVGKSVGEYRKKPKDRNYNIQLHSQEPFGKVVVDDSPLPKLASIAQFENATRGWLQNVKGDAILRVKTGSLSVDKAYIVTLSP